MSRNPILIVGGAGFIGSQINKMLAQAGYNTVVLDNLVSGGRDNVVRGTFVEGDMGDRALLDSLFSRYSFEAVIHFAALIDVGESMAHPERYYENNVDKTECLLQAMLRHQVKKLVFSSTAAVYGLPQQEKVTEEHPTAPINPYGESKLRAENRMRALDAHGLRSCIFRYFNAAGGDPEGEIKNRMVQSNLIPRALRSLSRPDGVIQIFGTDYPTPDGTCIRDYIHVSDLGKAHIVALKRLLEGHSSCCYNLGLGEGFSVREVLRSVERVTNRKLHLVEVGKRAGDPPRLVADPARAKKELGFAPSYDLDAMVAHAWKALNN